MHILVIDDEPVVRKMILRMLEEEKFELTSAENGKKGMHLLKIKSDVDLVITDIIMPEQEGIETILEIKENFPNIKILAISGGGKGEADDYLSIAESLGADGTLAKPFIRKQLIEAVYGLLGKV